MIVETHAHLDFPEFEGDLAQILERASAAGVGRIITIGTSVAGSRRALELARTYENVYAVIGVHPTSAEEAGDGFIEELRDMAADTRVVALGETGLDYHREPYDKAAQARVFTRQLDLARETGLNVVIHQRDAWDDTVALLRPYFQEFRAVFHCFGNSVEQADELFALGHYVSFTGIVTFKNAAVVKENARHAPADRYMVETDCPFLAPEPYRGKRCEPAHTRRVAETVAALRGETIEQVEADTTRNAERFFRFPPL